MMFKIGSLNKGCIFRVQWNKEIKEKGTQLSTLYHRDDASQI